MKVDLKCRLAVLPLLACSTAVVAAEPVLLGARDMDRITAGAQTLLERLASVIKTAQDARSSLSVDLPVLAEGQLVWLTQLASNGPVTLRRSASGELVAIQQVQSGDQSVIVKQLTAAEAAALPQLTQGDAVTSRLLQPGETLAVQQTASGGINYLYIRSTGNSTVTVSQHHL